MEFTTNKCSERGQAEIVIRCDNSVPIQDIEWLVALLESSVHNGVKYNAGELVQVGWVLNRLEGIGRGLLLLREPDFQTVPIVWTDGVTQTLRHLRLQKDTAESLGLGGSMQFPTIRDSAILGVDVARNIESLILERTEDKGTDSGWFVGNLASPLDYNDPVNLRRVSLYEAAIECPLCLMFMSLPFGTTVRYSRGNTSVSREGATILPTSNSFLERLCRPK
jgi:hypothetical protein